MEKNDSKKEVKSCHNCEYSIKMDMYKGEDLVAYYKCTLQNNKTIIKEDNPYNPDIDNYPECTLDLWEEEK